MLIQRGTSTTRARRQPQPELRQGLSSFRRRGRINATMRSQQPRASRQTSRRPSFLLSRERGSHFPPDMDLDMVHYSFTSFHLLTCRDRSGYYFGLDVVYYDYDMLLVSVSSLA